MSAQSRNLIISAAAILLTVTALATTSGSAQAPGAGAGKPQRISVELIQLKPDMVETWDTLMKEDLAGRKKTGLPWQQVWASGSFGESFARVVIRPFSSYEEYDEPMAAAMTKALGADTVARLRKTESSTLVSRKVMGFTMEPKMSIVGGSSTVPPLMNVTFRRIRPGKADEWAKVWAEDFIPNFKKTGLKEFWVYRGSVGVSADLFFAVRPMATYAELDLPSMMSRALSPEAVEAATAKYEPLLETRYEAYIYRVMPELSYGLPTGGPSTR